MSASRSKHIDIKYYFVKEKVTNALIAIEYMPTTSMLADPLTKGLPICVFAEHVARMELLRAYMMILVETCYFASILYGLPLTYI